MASSARFRFVRGSVIALAVAAILVAPGCATHRPASLPNAEPASDGEDSPTPREIERAARLARGLDPDGEGEIPPQDRWIGQRHDPPSGPSMSDDEQSNVRVNQDVSGYDQNETVISVSPTNPLNLIGGANDYRTGSVKCGYYASLDGGQTWVDGVLPEETYPSQGDPTVAFCADGSAVYVCLSFTGVYQPHGLFSYITTDGGQSWDGPHDVLNRRNGFPFADKEWVGCDRTPGSPFANRVYTTWTDLGFSGSPIQLRRSADGGRTWSNSVRVSDGGSTQGSVIATARNGTVYVAWVDSGTTRIGFDRSTDGGVTFGSDVFPSNVDSISADPVFRRNSFPTMDVDRSDGPHADNIYVAWSDDRNGDPDILLVRSTDGGQTWGAPLRVNDDALSNGADQWFPWLAVDPMGRVIVTFFDRRQTPGGRPYEIWGAISRDGGQTFDTNFIITDVASDGSLNGFIGDYSGLAATEDRLYPLWTDLRAGTGETDAYTDAYPNIFAYDEVGGLAWVDRDDLDFEMQDDRFDEDLVYDALSGFVSELRAGGSFESAECSAAAWPGPPYVDSREPPAGDAYWFLIRSHGGNGVGTYGDAYPPARFNVRDPLDQDLVLCP